jgi:hypothetical protein
MFVRQPSGEAAKNPILSAGNRNRQSAVATIARRSNENKHCRRRVTPSDFAIPIALPGCDFLACKYK